MSLDDKNENTEWRKSVFGWKLENKYEIERQNGMTSMNEKKIIRMRISTWYTKPS